MGDSRNSEGCCVTLHDFFLPRHYLELEINYHHYFVVSRLVYLFPGLTHTQDITYTLEVHGKPLKESIEVIKHVQF